MEAALLLARENGAPNDIATQAEWRWVAAMAASDDGRVEEAKHLIAEAVEMVEPTDYLELRAGAFDTTEGEAFSANALGEADSADEQLYLVQFVGPIKKQWVTELQSYADIVSYIPNNAYLVRANAGGFARINSLKSDGDNHVQWTGAFKPAYKIAPEISLNSDQEISSTIQLVSSGNTAREIQDLVARSSASVINSPTAVLNYTNIRVRVQSQQLAEIARMSTVVWIEPWSEPVLHDEKQDLILAGKLTGSEPASSYLAWLQSKGISSSPDFIVDVADTGIDQDIVLRRLDHEALHAQHEPAADGIDECRLEPPAVLLEQLFAEGGKEFHRVEERPLLLDHGVDRDLLKRNWDHDRGLSIPLQAIRITS